MLNCDGNNFGFELPPGDPPATDHQTHQILLTECLTNSDDDAVRGVYANWLRDNGNAGEQLLGRFIGESLLLYAFRNAQAIEGRQHEETIRAFDNDLVTKVVRGHAALLFGDAVDVPVWKSNHDEIHVALKRSKRPPLACLTYRRGMVAEVKCSLTEWHMVIPAVMSVCPVKLFRFAECEWLTLAIWGSMASWCGDLLFDRPEQSVTAKPRFRGVSPSLPPIPALSASYSTNMHMERQGLVEDLAGGFFELLQRVVSVTGFAALGLPDIPNPQTLERENLIGGAHRYHLCQHPGCENWGGRCEVPFRTAEYAAIYFCTEHYSANGFCRCCACFTGGISSFAVDGICDSCLAEYHKEAEDRDDFDSPGDMLGVPP